MRSRARCATSDRGDSRTPPECATAPCLSSWTLCSRNLQTATSRPRDPPTDSCILLRTGTLLREAQPDAMDNLIEIAGHLGQLAVAFVLALPIAWDREQR